MYSDFMQIKFCALIGQEPQARRNLSLALAHPLWTLIGRAPEIPFHLGHNIDPKMSHPRENWDPNLVML